LLFLLVVLPPKPKAPNITNFLSVSVKQTKGLFSNISGKSFNDLTIKKIKKFVGIQEVLYLKQKLPV
jgi:hypothetical protein